MYPFPNNVCSKEPSFANKSIQCPYSVLALQHHSPFKPFSIVSYFGKMPILTESNNSTAQRLERVAA